MSTGLFFVSKNKLDKAFFDLLHSEHYSGEEMTQFVKNPKRALHYYHIEPAVIYSPGRGRIDIDDREMGPAEYLRFFAGKLYRREGFIFLHCSLSDEDMADFYFTGYLKRCVKEKITIEDFNQRALDPHELFKLGIAYYVAT